MKTQSSQTSTRLDDLKELLLGDEQRELESLRGRIAESETALATFQEQVAHQEKALLQQIESEKAKLQSLQAALQDSEANTVARLAKDLVPALRQREKEGPEASDEFAAAMQSTTIAAIRKSVSHDKQPLTDALFPIMGPAIRSYVLDLVRGMAEDLNQSIQNATSLERIKWRVQAKMAGKPYSEFVLLKTRSFSIEEVYLMQRDTGLLLLHAAKNPANEANDEADLVSGMFTAIRSFVKDSFSSSSSQEEDNDSELDRFTFGDREVLIEVGPSLVLAAVVRGVPSPAVRDELTSILEQLHGDLQPALENFSGDTLEVEKGRPLLRQALIEQTPESDSRTGTGLWRAWVSLAALGLGIATLIFLSFREQAHWNKFESALRQEAGLSVSEVTKSGFRPRREVRGLKDPLAIEPTELAKQHGINLGRAKFRFKLIESLDEPLRSKRDAKAKKQEATLLAERETLSNQINELERKLEKSEQVHDAQLAQTTKSLIESILSDIPNLSFDLREEAIRLRGKLSFSDLELVQARIAPLQTLCTIDTSGLFDSTSERIENLTRQIEAKSLEYNGGTLILRRESELSRLIELLLELNSVAAETKTSYQYQIFAHPLIGDMREENRLIEIERCKLILSALTDKGLAPQLLPPKLSEDMSRAGDGISIQILTP